MTVSKLKIGDFRRVVESLNWSRNDLSGATSEEFIAMDVKTRLERHIEAVSNLLPLVPVRFTEDKEDARKAIEYAHKTIARWQEKKELAAKLAAQKAAASVQKQPSIYLVN